MTPIERQPLRRVTKPAPKDPWLERRADIHQTRLELAEAHEMPTPLEELLVEEEEVDPHRLSHWAKWVRAARGATFTRTYMMREKNYLRMFPGFRLVFLTRQKIGNSAGPIGGTLGNLWHVRQIPPGTRFFLRKLQCDFWLVSRSNSMRHPGGGCPPHPFSLFFLHQSLPHYKGVGNQNGRDLFDSCWNWRNTSCAGGKSVAVSSVCNQDIYQYIRIQNMVYYE